MVAASRLVRPRSLELLGDGSAAPAQPGTDRAQRYSELEADLGDREPDEVVQEYGFARGWIEAPDCLAERRILDME
jgi:hypothetical protein